MEMEIDFLNFDFDFNFSGRSFEGLSGCETNLERASSKTDEGEWGEIGKGNERTTEAETEKKDTKS